MRKAEMKNWMLCIAGSLVYCLGYNLFIKNMGIYAGGFVGISQLLVLPFEHTPLGSFNIQGILYLLINIPLFVIGLRTFGKRFIEKSFVVVVAETVFMSLIPTPASPIVDDMLTNCIVGGAIEGIGSAMTFVGYGSGGGTDILGLLLSKKVRSISVGKVAFSINLAVYLICACLFSIEIAVYSFIASIFCSSVVDRLHRQNRNVSVNILSEKYKEIQKIILQEINRDATVLDGIGAYSEKNKKLLISIMSEYELKILEKKIRDVDKDAFIFVHSNVNVLGHYEKRLS